MTQVEKINNELKIRRINQKEFCDAIQIPQNTFSSWKKRKTDVPSKYVARICNYFGWPIWQFLGCEEDFPNHEVQTSILNNSDASATEDEAYNLFKALPDSAKQEIMQTIMKRAREYISESRNEP